VLGSTKDVLIEYSRSIIHKFAEVVTCEICKIKLHTIELQYPQSSTLKFLHENRHQIAQTTS